MGNFLVKTFTEIAGQDELTNHLFTFGLDIFWRKNTVQFANQAKAGKWLDLRTGTGEMADLLEYHAEKNTVVYGLDFTPAMIDKV